MAGQMAGRQKWLLHPAAKPLIFIACLLPFAWLFYAAWSDQLGANPAEALVRATGDWTLRFVCIVLAVTPLRVITSTPALARFRRMLGLFAYFYVVLHLLSYSWFDMSFELADIARDIAKRPFILVGFSAFVLLTPLAATSFNAAIKAMGAKRWQLLHKLVYLIAGLGILHFFWMRAGKNNFFEVFVYAVIVAMLLGWRVWNHRAKARRRVSNNAVVGVH
ncbi:protein-methionine-sulfoxide reductase heme-binding subunit MsrQ [Polaromonas hydrogenivorans]|uniref:Protein-methionine-sulfoxide reductase heme-binding subunit MsrQ n=1 Tax=Polaromonas hydrogenivorans TaxID=335476 RepID=A0AAU7LPV0_9BURK